MANKRPYPRFAQDFSGDSKTQQHFAADCDINKIVATYDQTGIDPYADRIAQQRFGDGTYRTYLDAMNTVATLHSKFAELPMAIREQFNNDPELYLQAAEAQLDQSEIPIEDPPPEAPEEPLTPPPEDASEDKK